MERLLIIGAGAQARYLLNLNACTVKMEVIGLLDTFDNPDFWGKEIMGTRVLGNLELLDQYLPSASLKVMTAISNVHLKMDVAQKLKTAGYSFCSLIHPSASLAADVEIGEDVLINAGVVVEPGACIGNHVIIHANCVVEHDNVLEDFVNLAPAVAMAGRVKVRRGATVYTGAKVIPDIEIGENAVVGAGAVVIRDVPPGVCVAGVPARPLASA